MDPLLLGMIKKAGKPTDAQVSTAVNNYLTENPIQAYDDTEILASVSSLQSNRINCINMVELGCDNTGVTSCSTIISQAILNYSTLYFPEGTYLIDSSITVPDGVSIKGDGKSKTVFKVSSSLSGDVFIYSNNTHGYAEDFTIKGNFFSLLA